MPRPCCSRRVSGRPGDTLFKPAGVPLGVVEEVVMGLDEFEAIRLVDLQGLYQENAAEKMGISRPTLGRILEHGRRKIADVLANGKALRIAGGNVNGTSAAKRRTCPRCLHRYPGPADARAARSCPQCQLASGKTGNRIK